MEPDAGYSEMIAWIIARIRLPGYSKALWNGEHDEKCIYFITTHGQSRLFAYTDDEANLRLATGRAPSGRRLYYFVATDPSRNEKLTVETIGERIQHGTLAGGANMTSLLRQMNGLYASQIFDSQAWPESVKKDFTGHFHRFMASLTETANMDCGKTVLYLPSPKVIGDEAPAVAAKNKDLVQQLESIVIHWTRQIKEVVNSHDNAYHQKVSGPLEEIQFWRSRTVDLSGISEQLQQSDVRRVVAVLEASKSSYLARFESLVKKIQDNSIEANDNLKFLEHLVEPCEALARSNPRGICAILGDLLGSIRMIWTLSGFYNHSHPERLTGLLRKISNEIIHRCCAEISLTEIFDGDVEGSMVALDESIQCGVLWKRIYRKTAAAIKAATADAPDPAKAARLHWTFDDASIFAQIDAFVQRCRDLLEVCEGQMQFCRKSSQTRLRGKPGPLPRFGGTRGHEITKAIIEIQDQFEVQIDRLRSLDYEILDVKTSHWHDDYNVFKNSVKDLEVMYTNVMNTAFEGVTRVSEAVAALEIFYSLAKREAIQRCVEKKTVDAYMLFVRTVEDVRRDFDENRRQPPLRANEPKWAGSALWAKSNATLVSDSWHMLQAATYLVRTREYDDAEQAYKVLMGVLNDYKASLYKGWVASLDALDSTQLQARLETPLMRRSDQAHMLTGAAMPAASNHHHNNHHHHTHHNHPHVRNEGTDGRAPAPGKSTTTTTTTTLKSSSSSSKDALLECNFDRGLLAMFSEVQYWEKFNGEFSIPYVAHDICNQREKLRVMREHVMLVVRAYNGILYDLSTEERRLFSDHIRKLDKRINQGLVKLTWATKGVVEHYVKDCCAHCAEIHSLVRRYKAGKQHISKECRATAALLLLRIDKNAIYDEGVFEAKQAAHRAEVKRRFNASHVAIKSEMKDMFAHFRDGSAEVVQREWRELVKQVDREVETALRHTVKRSLQELSRAINGDAKSDPQTLFGVKIVLENSRIDYKPTMINLTHVVNIVAKELISTVAVVPRLRDVLNATTENHHPESGGGGGDTPMTMMMGNSSTTTGSARVVTVQTSEPKHPSFYSVISNDEDMLKIVVQIMNGMSSTATELQKYLGYWEKYKPIWEMDKEAYMRRYAKANRSLKNYHDDVSKYRDQQGEISVENMMHMINFVQLDCTLLKAHLVAHCQQWQQKLLGLLNTNARAGLDWIHNLFETSSRTLRTPPKDLEELSEKIKVLQDLKADSPSIAAKMGPIEDQYGTLSKFDVAVAPAETHRLTSLRTAWAAFEEMLDESQRALDKAKVNMKRDLEQGLESYTQYVRELRERQIVDMPMSADLDPAEAFEVIEAFKLRVLAVHHKKTSLKSGLEIFKIESPDHKELRDVEHDLELAEAIWALSQEWAHKFDGWKMGQFEALDVAEMEAVAGQMNKKVAKLGREIKRWGIWESMKTKLAEFLQTMPLIQDLKNPALRPRHWAFLKREVHRDFDETSRVFTLEAVFALGLNAVPEFISELSSNANKELAIEVSLVEIEKRWAAVDVEVQAYKDAYYKIKSTDDLFQVLEDDAVSLSTMKASKFYGSFKHKIDLWESNLACVSEVIDVLLTVQRKWIYLESIFMASEDICKQLPRESQLFVEVNDTFTTIMAKCFKHPNAVRHCTTPGMLDQATAMDVKLEAIQKSLDQYLETKRHVFPRFYFVSDDDLLEILGQSREPMQVQKHVKKMFEGFGAMEVLAPGKALNRHWECAAMVEPSTGETCAFVANVVLDGAVENWLCELEKAMVASLQKLLAASLQSFKGKKEKWVTDVQGQLLITTGAIAWTTDCTKALNNIASGASKGAMKGLKKKQVTYLNRLTEMIRGQLPKLVRKKLVALITMEIHNRDVMERMIKAGCESVTDFEWLSQLRFLFNKDEGAHGGIVSVRQTNCMLEYGYEYQGNNGRLVVTPLTDRCVLTLLTAKFLNRGGNPLGPAGTGKTETVKDLSKNLAMYCVVINCSDGMDYKSVGRIFSGLCQAGAWGCFDEFNRIKIEVISVVAMQVLSIVDALSRKAATFDFMGTEIRCNTNCGLFITMNPGYAGRTELPDNLKALMRPVAMMVPDLAMIAEVMLSAEGFTEARILSKKTITLYSLMQQQLSKQDHYDYGLRNLKAVLNMAGSLKRADPTTNEEAILMRALRDMNLPKFIKDDERLFRLLLSDLFPSLELPVSDMGELGGALEEELRAAGLQCHPFLLFKIGQLYDSKLTRHCNMMVGRTMSGKSTVWKTLAAAKGRLAKRGVEGYHAVSSYVINSKSITLTELYGAYDLQTFEWADGILSTIFKSCAESEKKEESWIMFDGPVDAMWIESMNSVMDDNKILTLINGDRIPLTASMSLLFEVEDLRVASPATVSRAGMIFVDASEMGLDPFVTSWLDRAPFAANNPEARAQHRALYDKYVPPLLAYKELNCSEPVPVADFNAVQSLTRTYDALHADPANGLMAAAAAAASSSSNNQQAYPALCEKWFAFACTWSICAAVDEAGRKKLDVFLRDVEAQYPPTNTIYDYYIDVHKGDFELWETTMTTWRPRKGDPFFRMIVPTTDTVRNSYVFNVVTQARHNLMVVGNTGVGKSVQVATLLQNLDKTKFASQTINFSATTQSSVLQGIIEGAMEKRSKDKLAPPGGKLAAIFCDDFNMPQRTSAESPFQPPLELLRLWMDYGGWYDRQKCAWRYVQDTQLIAAMAPPSGGRAVICSRTQARFHLVYATTPDDAQLTRIFESILAPKLADFDNEIKPMAKPLAAATIAVYQSVIQKFLPTPVKSHYLFNVRDVAKVVQGTLQAERQRFDTSQSMLRLWAHECMRVFSDRFVEETSPANDDFGDFEKILAAKMKEHFDNGDWDDVMTDVDDKAYGPILCSFMDGDGDGGGGGGGGGTASDTDKGVAYEEIVDFKQLKDRCEERLEDYNIEPKLINMSLVLFKDAIRHVCRIHRVLMMPRGNMMLVGVGGSGRQSLARLSAYIAGHAYFGIEITKQYRVVEWHDDMKRLFDLAGCQDKPTMFLFNDTQVKEESFLEDINNVLSSGEIPNLYAKDELPGIYDAVRKRAVASGTCDDGTPAQLWAFFVETLRTNLHVVLCMSPVGASLRTRCRYYPGLINNTTIDWFHRWPADALTAVGTAFLKTIKALDSDDDSVRRKVSEIFSVVHQSSIAASDQMLAELKRHNYITPTHFLELVKGYETMLREKSNEIGDARDKLANGLAKLVEARDGVAVMSVELEKKKVICAQSQKDCENLLVEIVSERRIADEQRKSVEADSERIGKEAIECEAIQQDAENDLMVALPALQKAMGEVDKLDKSSISEVKAYKAPPKAVETCLSAVMILFNQKTDWGTAKRILGEANFLQSIKSYNKDNVPSAMMKKVKNYVSMPDFTPEAVGAVSKAAGALCTWVHAIYIYANVAKDVAPKRAMLKNAQDNLAVKQQSLQRAQDDLAVVTAKVQALKENYDDSVGEKNRLRAEADQMQTLLERADKLVKGLAGENERWQKSITVFSAEITKCLGNSLVAAAFLSYAGPFDTSYRGRLVGNWMTAVKDRQIPFSDNFAFASYCAKPTDVRAWNIQGLPADDFSTENGVITVRCSRWPLMVDPQGQANKWVRKMEGDALRVVDLKSKDLLKTVENGIVYGMPVLLQDVLEDLDPALEPVLAKSIIRIGNRETLRLGDKELDYSHDFKLYITTKLGNPHYAPEVSTKTTIINFAVKQQGLEAQLLGIVVQKEQPMLEKQSSDLTLKVASGKKRLVELEDEILRLLSETKGSLLDDESLVDTLQQSKVTSDEVSRQLNEAEETKIRIDLKREEFRPAAIRSSIAYFVLDDMSRVDPMYQFSLDAYVDLFNQSMDNSRTQQAPPGGGGGAAAASKAAHSSGTVTKSVGGGHGAERCKQINAYHTLAVYQYTCRGLFEDHKLLFSVQLCLRIMMNEGKVPKAEFDFFMYGGVVVDRTEQRKNPCGEWIDALAWDNITELDAIPAFQGLASSLEQGHRDWKQWFTAPKPEEAPLPGDWENKVSELQRMCIVRALRLDRTLFAATRFVSLHLGPQFADPPAFDLKAAFATSTTRTPLIFVLSPGVDPTAQVMGLGKESGVRVDMVALGQGQGPVALNYLTAGLRDGAWVLLANCHLMLSFLPELEKRIAEYCAIPDEAPGAPHPSFRLWISASPSSEFPIAILQRSIKMTTEPPRGLRANMMQLYNLVGDDQFNRCGQRFKYRRLLFALSWFHAILLERRKFKSLGFNVPYEFNESDFSICHDLIIVFLDEYPDRTPFDAMRYLISEANYGGRVTDALDRRLVNVYITQFFCEDAVDPNNVSFNLAPQQDLDNNNNNNNSNSSNNNNNGNNNNNNNNNSNNNSSNNNNTGGAIYVIPSDADLRGAKEAIRAFPQSDAAVAFGQHANADISSQIEDSNALLTTIISLQPKVVVEGEETNEAKILRAVTAMQDQIPPVFDVRSVRATMDPRSDPEPMKTVLYQEIDRYNALLAILHRSLHDLELGVQGLVVVTPDLEEVMEALLDFKVPRAWSACYPSLKPLATWIRDLGARVEAFRTWIDESLPRCFWLPAFTYPTGFLTALLQTSARKNGIAIDTLSWEFPVVNTAAASITQHAKDGSYCSGLFLEGARWDFDAGTLTEPVPMELFCTMPVIHFKPAENKKKSTKGFYACPLYMYPHRTGSRERPSFIICCDLKSGNNNADYWTTRGTALLLSTAL